MYRPIGTSEIQLGVEKDIVKDAKNDQNRTEQNRTGQGK